MTYIAFEDENTEENRGNLSAFQLLSRLERLVSINNVRLNWTFLFLKFLHKKTRLSEESNLY